MIKTTVYMPDDLDLRLEARAATTSTSKAELIRRAVSQLLDETEPRRDDYPVFKVHDGGRSLSVEEMDEAIAQRIAERAARR